MKKYFIDNEVSFRYLALGLVLAQLFYITNPSPFVFYSGMFIALLYIIAGCIT